MEAGGTQALLMNLYRKIDRTKLQFDFLVLYKEKQFYDDEIENGGGKIWRFSFRENLNLFQFCAELKEFFLEHNEYKVVHCHAFTVGFFCLKAARDAGVPVRIAHAHTNNIARDFKYFPKLIMRRLYTLYATELFACSHEAGKFFFNDKPFTVIKNAIDSSKFVADLYVREKTRAELQLDGKFVVGHVGRFHLQKNHAFLIKIFKCIKAKKPDAHLLLVGNGDLETKITQMIANENLSDSVLILKNRSDMSRLYQAMDVFVLPSFFEGLGIVAVEAQASGIPCICSNGVSIEANISPLFKQLNLNDDAQTWADNVILWSENMDAHADMHNYVISSGYDICAAAKEMQLYYITATEKCELF